MREEAVTEFIPPWVRWVWATLLLIALAGTVLQITTIMIPVAFAWLIAAALGPSVDWLEARGWNRSVVAIASFAAIVVLFSVIAGFLVPAVVDQVLQVANAAPELAGRLDWLRESWSGWRKQYGVIPTFAEATKWVVQRLMPVLERMGNVPGAFVNVMVGTVTTLFLAFYFLVDGHRLNTEILSLVPRASRDEAGHLVASVNKRVGLYMAGQLVVMALVGLLTWLGLHLVGVPYALLLGVAVGVLDIVPFIGPFLVGGLGILIALGVSWKTAVWAILVFGAVQQLESYVLFPAIVGRAVSVHPVWLILALLIGAEVLGLAGMALAVPVAVAIQTIIEEWYQPQLATQGPQPESMA